MTNEDLNKQRVQNEDIMVEEITDRIIRIETKSPIENVSIYPLLGGGYSITVLTEEDIKNPKPIIIG